MAKIVPLKDKLTKSGLLNFLAEETEYTKAECQVVLDALEKAMIASLHPKGYGEFTLPGLLKVKTRKVAAVKGGQKKKNPLTGGMYVTKDRPATVKVRVLPLAKLKEAAVTK